MILKRETTGTMEYVLFKCAECGRTFGHNMGLPKDPLIRERILAILDQTSVCDECVEQARQAEKEARMAEIQRQEESKARQQAEEAQMVQF